MSHEHHHHRFGEVRQNNHEAHHNAPHAEPLIRADIEPSRSAAEGVVYTCPMHPQIRQPDPGNCPICGMTLEPLVSTMEERAQAPNSWI
jgi:P-type Cu+ transporter